MIVNATAGANSAPLREQQVSRQRYGTNPPALTVWLEGGVTVPTLINVIVVEIPPTATSVGSRAVVQLTLQPINFNTQQIQLVDPTQVTLITLQAAIPTVLAVPAPSDPWAGSVNVTLYRASGSFLEAVDMRASYIDSSVPSTAVQLVPDQTGESTLLTRVVSSASPLYIARDQAISPWPAFQRYLFLRLQAPQATTLTLAMANVTANVWFPSVQSISSFTQGSNMMFNARISPVAEPDPTGLNKYVTA